MVSSRNKERYPNTVWSMISRILSRINIWNHLTPPAIGTGGNYEKGDEPQSGSQALNWCILKDRSAGHKAWKG